MGKAMWDQISDLHACHREVSVEISLLKLSEETGEVAEAFIGRHGLNSRREFASRNDPLASWRM
jgi:NTP pyrophosphatase (non-canonical NTP hydrolase)